MPRIRALFTGAALLALNACGAPVLTHTAGLQVSAQDAVREADLQARSWRGDAVLRYAEGVGISAAGYALAGSDAFWRFVYDAPGVTEQFEVRVAQATEEHGTRTPQSPPGYVLGDARLDRSWIDSPRALESIRASLPAGAAISMLLVPTNTPQWVIRSGDRTWRVNARTGAIMN